MFGLWWCGCLDHQVKLLLLFVVLFFSLPDSVYSVSVDGSGTIACSGGKDDQGLVWKVADGSLLFQCGGKSRPRPSTSSSPLDGLFPRFSYLAKTTTEDSEEQWGDHYQNDVWVRGRVRNIVQKISP